MPTRTLEEAAVRHGLNELMQALRAKDIDAQMAHDAPDTVVFELRTPSRIANSKRAIERYAAAMADAVVLQVRVKPRSRVSSLQRGDGGAWIAHVKAPPVDGKANAEVIALVASHFGCARSAVTIQSGASGRTKLVRVQGLLPA